MSPASHWGEIQSNYESYLDRYPDEGMISTGHPGSDFPLQSGVLNRAGNYYERNYSGLERDCLAEFSNSTPSINELIIDDLALLPLGLLDILKIQITHDHTELWKETAYVLSNLNSDTALIDDGVARNIEILTRLVLSPMQMSLAPSWEWNEEAHLNSILTNSHIIASYMAYPTLEGLIKSLCSDDIAMDGTVKPGQTITNLAGPDYQKGTGNDKVSSIRDLLNHLEESGNSSLSRKMENAREIIADFYNSNTDEVYGLIYDRRNSTLHGEAEASADYGIALTMVSLLVWDEITTITR